MNDSHDPSTSPQGTGASTSGAIKHDEPPPSTGSATTSVGSSGNHGQPTPPQAAPTDDASRTPGGADEA